MEILLFQGLIGGSLTPSGTFYYFYGEECDTDIDGWGAPWNAGTYTAVLDLSEIDKNLTYWFGARCANGCYYHGHSNYHNSVTITEVWLE